MAQNQLNVYSVNGFPVFGCTIFKPPFKVSDTLINEARIVYVVQGKSKLYSANDFMYLENGNLVIMKTDNFINHWQINDSDEMNKVIVFQITADFLNHLYNNELPSWFIQNNNISYNSIVKVESSPIIDSFFNNLNVYLNNPNQLTEEVIQIKIKEIISIMVQSDHTGAIKKIFANLFRANDYSFQETIQKNLYENLSIEDLAFFTGMSLSSFKRKFASVYGTTPNKYIISKRLEKAQEMLRSNNLNISEIAYECGFSDVGYFSKTFRKYYNISPSEFKNFS